MKRCLVGFLPVAVLLGGCPQSPSEFPQQPPYSAQPLPITPPVVAVANSFAAIKDRVFERYDGPFDGRKPAPAISSYKQDPVNALGSIYAQVAKESKKCSSEDPNDFDYQRLIEQRPVTCQSKVYPPTTVAQMLVDGKAAGNIDYIIGKAGISAEYAYEFIVTEPVTAVLTDTGKCVVDAEILKFRLPDRTCDLRYVAGLVITQVSYRQYKKLSADASASYVVKVGGQAYGSSEQLVNKWFLTVDPITLNRFFARDESTGFLKSATAPTPLATMIASLPRSADTVRAVSGDHDGIKASDLVKKWNVALSKEQDISVKPPQLDR